MTGVQTCALPICNNPDGDWKQLEWMDDYEEYVQQFKEGSADQEVVKEDKNEDEEEAAEHKTNKDQQNIEE